MDVEQLTRNIRNRITAALFLIYIPQTPDGLEDFKT